MFSVIAAPPTFLDDQVGPAYPPADEAFVRTGIFGSEFPGNGIGFGARAGGRGRASGLGGGSAWVARLIEPTGWRCRSSGKRRDHDVTLRRFGYRCGSGSGCAAEDEAGAPAGDTGWALHPAPAD